MKAKNIRNGSLYFDTSEGQVTRVLGAVNSARVLTKRHTDRVSDARVQNLRKASNKEVDVYTQESMVRDLTPKL
jgi:uncharacterized DUF497 family protein